MKKLIASLMAIAVLVWVAGPLMVVANQTVDTSLVKSSVGGAAPIVKVKWEMDGGYASLLGTDAQTTAGAQFMPSGKYKVNKTIGICAVATDPDGVADIDSVYGDVFYPTNVYLGPDHEADRQGCGQMVGTECRMTKLDKSVGIDLICDKIRSKNSNLPTWYDGYNYDEICKADGELMKETAYVYCCDKVLSYEDPSGDYKVLVFAQDKNGADSNYLENQMRYLPLTAFETDFNQVVYGDVKLNTHKIINGNLAFAPTVNGDTMATVRNVGNTRLQMSVSQDDMGLGQTGTTWNVKYDGRVGSDAAWSYYWPNATKYLNDPLNLSETNEMDFSVDISKFPPTGTSFIGKMTLGAISVAHLTVCPQD
ncbi:MAG: hypothetical protein AUJ25_00455 [Parcubacteria group bacterium CG1_02_37_13]|nr:MAG: hypothetical protein AUJ25_00455 [Parcubacteria group bacterium CG1_02_37_13]